MLAKGTDNNWNQQNRKEGLNDNKSLSDKPDIGTRLNTFKRRAKKAKVILRNALFDLIMFGSVAKRNKTQTVFMSNVKRLRGLIGFHIV